ncbi:MAG: NrfD/PsrC family molybdoenzyme membrane anchor subunit [Myxococcota bacterium]
MDPTAIVTLDVLHNGVIWGWPVTMNMWAKSVATGVVLVGWFAMRRSADPGFYRRVIPAIGLVFIAITLLFTLYDLHQPLRAWHLYVWPHLTSMVNIGGWVLNGFACALVPFAWWAWRDDERSFDRWIGPMVGLAFVTTVYTGALLGQATAREIWIAPTEGVQMLLAAGLGGAGALSIAGAGRPADERRLLGSVLGVSAAGQLLLFLAEIVFAPQKSEESAWVIHELVSGSLGPLFLSGLGLAFLVPALLSWVAVRTGRQHLFPVAAVCALAGLWAVKHAWLVAPQLLPLS